MRLQRPIFFLVAMATFAITAPSRADITVIGNVTVDDGAGPEPLLSSGVDQIFGPGSQFDFFDGSVTIDNGMTLGGGTAILGRDPAQDANLNLNNGTIDLVGDIFLGDVGNGTITATAGSVINANNFTYNNPTAEQLTLDASTLSLTGDLFLNASLVDFVNGSTIDAVNVFLATGLDTNVFVDLIGSTLNAQNISFGNEGSGGSFDASAGSTITAAAVSLGPTPNADAQLFLTGAGTSLTVAGALTMGPLGGPLGNGNPNNTSSTIFSVLDGATAQVDRYEAGTGEPGLAALNINGAGSQLDVATDAIWAFGSRATARVENGGLLTVGGNLSIAIGSGGIAGDGFLVLDGGQADTVGATLVGSATEADGADANGFISLDNGASYTTAALGLGISTPEETQVSGNVDVRGGSSLISPLLSAGIGVNGRGSVTVSCAGSSVTTDTLEIGLEGATGFLDVEDQGSLSATNPIIAGAGGTAFINVDTDGFVLAPLIEMGFDTADNTAQFSSLGLNGGTIQADLNLSPVASLRGNGTIIGNVVNAGDVAPDNPDTSIGTLLIDGNFTHQSGNLFFDVAGTNPGEFDQLFVTGDLDLQQGAAFIDFINGFTPVGGEQFPVLAAQGNANVGETFAFNVGTGETAFEFSLAPGLATDPVSGQQVNATVGSVNLLNANIADVGAIGTMNDSSLALNIDRTCTLTNGLENLTPDQQDLNQVCQQVRNAGNTPEQVEQILAAVGTEETTQTTNALLQFTVPQHGNTSQRINGIRGGSNPFDLANLNLQIGDHQIAGADLERFVKKLIGGAAGEDDFARFGMFGNGNINFGDKSASRQGSGFEYETVNLTIGADYRLRDDIILGGSVSYSDVNANFDEGGGMNVKSWSASLFASYFRGDKWYIDLLSTYGQNELDISRHVTFNSAAGGLNRRASSDTDGEQYSISLGTGYDFTPGKWTIGPHGGLNFTELETDPYTEQGAGGLNLTVERQNAKSFTANLGFHASYVFTPSWGVITPYLQADIVHEFETSPEVINIRFAADQFGNDPTNPSAPIRVETDNRDRWFTVVSAGFSAQLVNGISGFLAYRNTLGMTDLDLADVTWGVRFERHF